jgi:hypothetical protein
MPNPVDDYELEVYCTPLSEYGEGWGDKYHNRFVTYDKEEEEWNLRSGDE